MMTTPNQLAEAVANDAELRERMKADPERTLKSIGAMPLQTDVWIYRGVVFALGGTLLFVVMAAASLSFYSRPIPDVLTALGSAAVGALAGLLAPSPMR